MSNIDTLAEKIDSAISGKVKFNKDILFELVFSKDEKIKNALFQRARLLTDKVYGRGIYFRGLIEFTNYCEKSCYYCGLRFPDKQLNRYRMSNDEIYEAVKYGHSKGIRSFVLQGGEDSFFDDDLMVDIIKNIKKMVPDSALTLSIGEKSYESYLKYRQAGADRYLLRHEAVNEQLYSRLHPKSHSVYTRLKCLDYLKELGFQAGAGFMVGAPYQDENDIIDELVYMYKFNPEMVGIGPFIPNESTPFKDFNSGSVELTIRLLSVIRVLLPNVLLPATTALETLCPNGIIEAFEHGANVVMPNLTPFKYRREYRLYDNKNGVIAYDNQLEIFIEKLKKFNFKFVNSRGDYRL